MVGVGGALKDISVPPRAMGRTCPWILKLSVVLQLPHTVEERAWGWAWSSEQHRITAPSCDLSRQSWSFLQALNKSSNNQQKAWG